MKDSGRHINNTFFALLAYFVVVETNFSSDLKMV